MLVSQFLLTTSAVSEQPFEVQKYINVPRLVIPEIVVVGDEVEVMVVETILETDAVHTPVPVAAIVAVPIVLQVLWSGPALGLVCTTRFTVSLQLPLVL